jgi:SAM-dependent methyltransferase
MPPATADTPYALGATSAEHARLIRQAVIWDPFTERLFRDAGIGPGQRVLDIGSGVGDVAMLAARLVGPSGAVIGVERDPATIATARSRVAKAALSNVSFIECDVRGVPSSELFQSNLAIFARGRRPPAVASHTRSARGRSCVSRRMAYFAVPFDRQPPTAIKMRIAHLSDPRALRRAHGHGVDSLPRVLGSGSRCSEIPH